MNLDTDTTSPFELTRAAVPAPQPILEAKKMDTHIVDPPTPASAAAPSPLNADAWIVRTAAKWLELDAQVAALDEERDAIWDTHLKGYDDLRFLDPRGAAAGNFPSAVAGFGSARVIAYEKACAGTSYSEVSDRREMLSNQADLLLGALLAAKPATLPGRLARLRVLATREWSDAADRVNDDEWLNGLAASILEDVEALDDALGMAELPASCAGSIAELAREYISLEARGPMSDEECNRGINRQGDILDLLEVSPSVTPDELLGKLSVAACLIMEAVENYSPWLRLAGTAVAEASRFIGKAQDRPARTKALDGPEERRLEPEWERVFEGVENGDGDPSEMMAIIEYVHRAMAGHKRQPDRPEAPQGVVNCLAMLHLASGSLLGVIDLAEMRKAAVG